MPRLGPVLGASLLAWPATTFADAGPGSYPSEHANMSFGAALAADGSRLAVGAPGDNRVGFEAGAVFIYTYEDGTWALRQRLRPEPGPYQYFGRGLALDGDTLLIAGAEPLPDGGSRGVSHLYMSEDGEFLPRERWVLDLHASLGYLGMAVALDGDTLAFGARLVAPTATASAGRIRVMRRASGAWIEEADIEGGPDEPIGEALALHGEWLFTQASNGERIAVYRRDAGGQWRAQADLELPAADAAVRSQGLVSADGVLVVAQARSYPEPERLGLRFYGLDAGTWRHRETRDFVGADDLPRSGSGLALTDGRLAYTTLIEDFGEVFRSEATIHLFRREADAWVDDGEVSRSVDDPDLRDGFGAALALGDGWLIAGSPEYGEILYERSGKVDAFARDGEQWTSRQTLDPDDVLTAEGCGCRGAAAPGWCVVLLLLPRRRRKS